MLKIKSPVCRVGVGIESWDGKEKKEGISQWLNKEILNGTNNGYFMQL